MRRKKAMPSIDGSIFNHTAQRTKQINIDPGPMRGGIRL